MNFGEHLIHRISFISHNSSEKEEKLRLQLEYCRNRFIVFSPFLVGFHLIRTQIKRLCQEIKTMC